MNEGALFKVIYDSNNSQLLQVLREISGENRAGQGAFCLLL